MSNKKTENISQPNDDSSGSRPINLSGESYPKHKRKKYLPKFAKHTDEQKQIQDIYSEKNSDPKSGTILKVKEKPHYYLISSFLRIAVAGFVILLAINSINVYKKGVEAKESITYSAYEGYSKLLEGSKSTTKVQFIEAKDAFENALESFEEAENTLWFIADDDTIYAKQSSLGSSAKAILESGKSFAKAGEYFAESLEELNKIPLYFISKNEDSAIPVLTSEDEDGAITGILKTGIEKASLALIETRAARDEIEKINESMVPQEIRGKLLYAKEKLSQLIKTLESIEEHFPAVLKLLGDKAPHQYLVILQNNAEPRPTGGFIGSYALLNIDKGMIKDLKVEDVYDLDTQKFEHEPPSDEIYNFMLCCRFRNVNYSPDFFHTGRIAAWMIEQESGVKVDTVIALNQSSLKDFLEITGPVQVGDLPNKIDAENYIPILTYIIEAKIWGAEDPKHVLKVLVPEFKSQLVKTENVAPIMSATYKAAQQKMFMAYSKDSTVEALFDTLGVSGRFKKLDEKEDFLSVVHTSDAGNKTEHLIEEEITHKTEIHEDGELIDELTIARTHTFSREHQAEWNEVWDSFGFNYKKVPGYVVDILGRATNVMLTRIYVPEGSQLLEVVGGEMDDVEIDYDSELDRTYFEMRLSTPPQNTSYLTLRYKLPFELDLSPLDTYKFTAQKQPGSLGSVLTKTIETIDNDESIPYAYYPEDAYLKGDHKVVYATNLVYDRYFSAVFGD
jgi:chaperonin cofactor prefoldin